MDADPLYRIADGMKIPEEMLSFRLRLYDRPDLADDNGDTLDLASAGRVMSMSGTDEVLWLIR
jgi:hypothetical protein